VLLQELSTFESNLSRTADFDSNVYKTSELRLELS